jgi:hypothetical protein
MAERFSNKQDWFTAGWAMVVWTAHFGVLYGASIIWPGHAIARWIAVAGTVAAAGALYWLWRRAERPSIYTAGGLGLAIGAAGVVFDFAPAIFS